MRIGFDAKRAFFNRSGLGNYSRSLIASLSGLYPENEYYLFTPSYPGRVDFNPEKVHLIQPETTFGKLFPSWWRSRGIKTDILKNEIDIFHGLSNELPVRIKETGIKTVITIHDLIFLRYPELYKPIDRKIYFWKSKSGCMAADRVIAISNQTKNDIIEYYGIDESRIDIVYQASDPLFGIRVDEQRKHAIRNKYNLPAEFLLTVGTIEKRKNLLNMVKALEIGRTSLPLVAIGRPTAYIREIQEYIETTKLQKSVILLHDVPTEELPAFYQMASVFLYPSIFEGFGIPILEALNSGTPVITSQGGCFSEVSGPAGCYVNPLEPEEIANAIDRLCSSDDLRNNMTGLGYKQAENFTAGRIAECQMNIYKKLADLQRG
jgi:glycosyltransferase involved in cell wall biosynthesis